MVMEDGVVKALNVEPKGTGLSCSPTPSISLQLRGPRPRHTSSAPFLPYLPSPGREPWPSLNWSHPTRTLARFLQ